MLVATFFEQVWNVLLELSPWLLFGTALSSLLHKLLPPNWIEQQLQGRLGVLKSVIFGIPLPLCSCSVIPTGLGLEKQGSSKGATVGFLIATPQTGVDSIVVSASFLGLPFALFKVGAALVTGLIGGLWVEQEFPTQTTKSFSRKERKPVTWVDSIEHGLDIISSIWKWLVIGILLSAAISTLIPTNGLGAWIAQSSWGNIGASLLALAISIPLYVCATASVPIAAALVHGGLPLSAALVFLMAGPATNIATIGAVRDALGNRITTIYLSTVIVGSLLLGTLFDGVLTSSIDNIQMHEHHNWWAQASAIILIGLIGYFAFKDFTMHNSTHAHTDTTKTISVDGMTCNGCVSRLQKVLQRLDGVTEAVVTLEPGEAKVDGTILLDAIVSAIQGAGFDVVERS